MLLLESVFDETSLLAERENHLAEQLLLVHAPLPARLQMHLRVVQEGVAALVVVLADCRLRLAKITKQIKLAKLIKKW